MSIYIRKKQYKKATFYRENGPPLELLVVPTSGGFQGAVGQGTRWSHPRSLSQERLHRVTFLGPFQAELLDGSVILCGLTLGTPLPGQRCRVLPN